VVVDEVTPSPGGGTVERIASLFGGVADPKVVREREADATYVFGLEGHRLRMERRTSAGRHERGLNDGPVDRGGSFSFFSAAPDRLRGGALVFFLDGLVGWRLMHVPRARADSTDVVDLGDLPASPAGSMASNETEALVPLADGTLAFVPLALSELRFLEPVEGAPVLAMEIVMRPGESAGGLLYTHESAGEVALRYQPLICNR
jgi:hypothetical protein